MRVRILRTQRYIVFNDILSFCLLKRVKKAWLCLQRGTLQQEMSYRKFFSHTQISDITKMDTPVISHIAEKCKSIHVSHVIYLLT